MLLKEKILPYRQQTELLDRWLKKRLDTVIPMILDRWNQDMWIVACEEYNEEPPAELQFLYSAALRTVSKDSHWLVRISD